MFARSLRQRVGAGVALGFAISALAGVAGAADGPGGAADTTFGGGDGRADLPTTMVDTFEDSQIVDVIALADGSAVVRWVDGDCCTFPTNGIGYLTKLTAGGDVDTSFAGDGTLEPADVGDAATSIAHVARMPEGDLLVGVDGVGLGRFDAAGVLDTAFGDGGFVSSITESIPRPDGSILARGEELIGLTAAGDEDPTFTAVPTGRHEAVLSDGRIVVLPWIGHLKVYSASGAPDPGVGAGTGAVSTPWEENQFVSAGPNGTFIVEADDGESGLVLARFTSTGTIDTTFGNAGVLTVQGAHEWNVPALVDASGGVTAAYMTPSIWTAEVARFDSDGTSDNSFGDEGHVYIYDAVFGAVPFDNFADGSLLAGVGAPENNVGHVLKFGDDGVVDMAYGLNGARFLGLVAEKPLQTGLALPVGDSGAVVRVARGHLQVTMLDPTGAPDASFGDAGVVEIELNADVLAQVAVDADAAGRLYLLHQFAGQQWAVTRLSPTGALDPSWGGDGRVEVDSPAPAFFESFHYLRVVGDGTVSVLGSRWQGTDAEPEVVLGRYSASGSRLPNFNIGADLEVGAGENPDWQDGILDSSGGFVLVIDDDIRRFGPTGTLDPRWGQSGHVSAQSLLGCMQDRITEGRRGGIVLTSECGTVAGLTARGKPDGWLPPGTAADIDIKGIDRFGRLLTGSATSLARRLGNAVPDASFNGSAATAGLSGLGRAQFDASDRILITGRSGTSPDTTDHIVRMLGGAPPAPFSVSSATSTTTVSGFYRPVRGDFNGDGRTDILWYGPGTAPDSLWFADDDNSFGKTGVSVGGNYRPIGGDFNGDGLGDILWYTPGTGSDALWLARSTGGFTKSSLTVNGTYTPVAADVTGDGRTDIVWYAPGTASDTLWMARSTGGFTSRSLTVNGIYRPVSGDFNGDRRDDIVWYAPGSAGDVLWTSTGGGLFTTKSMSIGGDYTPIGADFNGDGLGDILWYRPGATADPIWRARWSGGFTSQPNTVSGTYVPVAGDFNGDTLAEVFWYGSGGDPDRIQRTTLAG